MDEEWAYRTLTFDRRTRFGNVDLTSVRIVPYSEKARVEFLAITPCPHPGNRQFLPVALRAPLSLSQLLSPFVSFIPFHLPAPHRTPP